MCSLPGFSLAPMLLIQLAGSVTLAMMPSFPIYFIVPIIFSHKAMGTLMGQVCDWLDSFIYFQMQRA